MEDTADTVTAGIAAGTAAGHVALAVAFVALVGSFRLPQLHLSFDLHVL